jgi:hypothetical protein
MRIAVLVVFWLMLFIHIIIIVAAVVSDVGNNFGRWLCLVFLQVARIFASFSAIDQV